MMRRVVLVLVVALSLAACGGPVEMAQVAAPVVATPATTPPKPLELAVPEAELQPAVRGLSTPTLPAHTTLVAMTVGDTAVYETMTSPEPFFIMPHTTILGTVTVLEVVAGPSAGWARVRLPIRPNGAQGWVRANELMLYVVDSKVEIDLSDRTLTYYELGEEVLTTSVAVGTERNPTPVGEFFVTDNVTLANPGSPWGPHAFGISARSDTITEYNGGDGIIGIHGTNRPASIGNSASLGCVRVPNEVITTLHEIVPIGTPVEITA
jgi:lipoprotein-anchoring transpeptidase ErfK/SrfK